MAAGWWFGCAASSLQRPATIIRLVNPVAANVSGPPVVGGAAAAALGKPNPASLLVAHASTCPSVPTPLGAPAACCPALARFVLVLLAQAPLRRRPGVRGARSEWEACGEARWDCPFWFLCSPFLPLIQRLASLRAQSTACYTI